MHLRARLRRQYANAGFAQRHIRRLNRGHRFWRNGDPFVPHAVVGAHHQQRLFFHLRHTFKTGHARQLHGKIFKASKASGRFQQTINMKPGARHRAFIRRRDRAQ